MPSMAKMRLCVAIVAVCAAAALPQLASAKPRVAANAHKVRNDAPLRFDPPAAGTPQRGSAAYDDCVDHPSPDGAAINCEHLRPLPQLAKPKRQH